MLTDLEIAQRAKLAPITDIAARLGIPAEAIEPYGRTKAKVSLDWLAGLNGRPNGRLVLVSAISPTPAGEGKTTTTIGLVQGLAKIGVRSAAALREPSLGPVFGMKGGGAGGGASEVLPMMDINMHFNGDFHAITSAHNLLAAMVDNCLHNGSNTAGLDPRRVTWKRVIDMNDRALRNIIIGLGGTTAYELPHIINTGRFDVVLTAFNYSLLWREAANEVLPAAKKQGMGIVIGSPLQQGALARRYDDEVRGGAR